MILKKSYWIIIKNSTGVKTRSHSVPMVIYAVWIMLDNTLTSRKGQ